MAGPSGRWIQSVPNCILGTIACSDEGRFGSFIQRIRNREITMGATMQLNEKNHYFIVFVLPREGAEQLLSSQGKLGTERFSSTVHQREYASDRSARTSGVSLAVYGSPSIAALANRGDDGVTDLAGGPSLPQYTILVRDLNSDLDGNEARLREEVPRIAAEEFPGHLYYQLCCASVK
jgi:hypothetical protein